MPLTFKSMRSTIPFAPISADPRTATKPSGACFQNAARLQIACMIAALLSVLIPPNRLLAEEIDFDRHIRPILANGCFACHGPDEEARKAELRLDTQDGIFKHETPVVIPSHVAESELFARITSDDPDSQMPPHESGKKLTDDEIQLIKKWIDQGAEWGTHWAYVLPSRPKTPPGTHPIDALIQARLTTSSLRPAPEADRVTLVRRLSFDLTGLPPSKQQVHDFVNDTRDDAYDRLVDSFLESPHYGERMAQYWLDVVRYADSNGYHSDEPRSIAPYRDYVIRSFNENIPYNEFVIEQLAGDLLPNPTINQRVASGFNMLLQTTSEGGAQAKEYLAKYAADRVRNTSSIFLGSTMGCAECHDHKFDPFTAKDFYSFAAFFADVQEKGVGNPEAFPVLDSEAQFKLAELDAQIQELQTEFDQQAATVAASQSDREREFLEKLKATPQMEAWHVIGPFKSANGNEAFEKAYGPETKFDIAEEFSGLKWAKREDLPDGKPHSLNLPDSAATYLHREIYADVDFEMEVSLGSDDGFRVWLNGNEVLAKNVSRGVAADQEKATLSLKKGTNRLLLKIVNQSGRSGFYFEARPFGLNLELASILKMSSEERNDDQKAKVLAYFESTSPALRDARKKVDMAKARRQREYDQLPKTLMTVSVTPRTMRLLNRGNWLDDSGPEVAPAVPAFLQPLETNEGRANRLDLANWIVDKRNPLTARTFVNRLWKLFFGQGLATPLDDLGAQGTRPTQPDVLDWLAVEFMEKDWNVKHIVRTIVLSDTYQQSSLASAEAAQKDPYNQLYARQSRFRLDAEMVRDNALSISGLLVTKIGGSSVKPYQPAGYWRHMNFPVRRWQQDNGDDQYRRGLYTWWQRMFLHPSMLAFDAPSREECTVERPRSNTPQQALVLLNDPTYVEAARVFAQRILTEGGSTAAERIDWAFEVALSRPPNDQERTTLEKIVNNHLETYDNDAEAAAKAVGVGLKPVPDYFDKSVLAAWTSVARVILNLHETITRR